MLRDRLERSRVSIENNFRISIGLSAFNSYDELLDSDPEQISDKKDEIILNEAADILIDQISLNYPARLTISR